MKKLTFKNFIKFSAYSLWIPLVYSSCESNNETIETHENIKKIKITLTVDNPIDDTDEILISVHANTEDSLKILKINDEIKEYNTVSLTTSDFKTNTNTYTIETVRPVKSGILKIILHNNVTAHPRIPVNDLKYSYKIEVNGDTKVDVNNNLLSGIDKKFEKEYKL